MTDDEAKKLAAAHYREAIVKLYGVLGFGPGECRSCGRAIWWAKTKTGKNIPLTADATAHFKDCPNAEEHRRK
jgi:hypothetical protein